ncbi:MULTISPECIES: hypothetical protein [unclassified Caballeronia]|uniref:hypothetical protein n=1 Tax=unclassified Caballeronia TaxID=2646786 RepID=UPI00286547E4|nr:MULTISPECIES: hypothetical protein [unclassified Caballeronia]MDR5777663.1 hypothetical protein [Caballeronia sp. LZ002]MDR5800445.1 hypothetical protein [Caballeronia sp. LZ001]MDR5800589.1 hypothetical protein [Caballeronia sp. LZ001]MDR5801492.1 hypothetical protein [Caballeronia sp. LZ001]MDR5801630.1 hypothetical protein [Caballeronia sp. LZ001]
MQPIVLTVRVPVVGLVTDRGMRGRYTIMTQKAPITTMVHGLRRVRHRNPSGRGDEQYKVNALAFIPVGYRGSISRSDWVDHEYAWVDCLYADNRKSLTAFRDSGDHTWMAPDAPISEGSKV